MQPNQTVQYMDIEKLRFPIGKFTFANEYSEKDILHFIEQLENIVEKLKVLVSTFTPEQLDITYREGGWSVRQVIHHLADSHMNSFVRFRLALTESNPTIKPYYEERWATLEDSAFAPVEWSLQLLDALHRRWVFFLKLMTNEDWNRTFVHPETKREFTLKEALALYAWHGEHHYQHINQLKIRMNW